MANFAIARSCALVGVLLGLMIAPVATAQDYLRSFGTDPIVVFSGDGHRAPVHRVLYTHDGKQLLTAGEDKEVLIWNLAENPPRLASNSIRPLIWKGARGAIRAMALSPGQPNEANPGGLLVLGGYGIEQDRGTLSRFRFPGLVPGDRRDTGELIGHWTGVGGHRSEIHDLAFDPSGKFLASASHDQNNPIQIWDVAAGARHRKLSDAAGPFWAECLAYSPSGNLLIAGGTGQDNKPDGWIRLWDLRRPATADAQPIRLTVGGDSQTRRVDISAVAVSPDGRWLVAGLSRPIPDPRGQAASGLVLVDLKAAQGLVARLLPFERPDPDPALKRRYLGRVYAVTFLDKDRFAVASAVEVGPAVATRRPAEGTWIQIRSAPDGKVIENVRSPEDDPAAAARPWPGLTRNLAVRPDGRQLAFVEGERNRVVLKDLDRPNAPAVGLVGAAAEGRKAWQVGFTGPGPLPKLAYSASRPGENAAGGPQFAGFDLETLQPIADPIDPAGVSRSLTAWGGYSVRVVPQTNQLEVVGPNGAARPIVLDRDRHGAWMTWSFIPPAEGHPRPCLAVACQFGVVILALDPNGPPTRTRFLDGHAAEVLDLAPDPAGRWLVTGGADQTVRLWSLNQCDRVPALGARFVRQGPRLVVTEVDARSPADLQGLKRGDQLTYAFVDNGQKDQNLVSADPRNNPEGALAQSEPGLPISLKFVRPNPLVLQGDYRAIMTRTDALLALPKSTESLPGVLRLTSRKADSPILTLFQAGQDWIVWTPQGFYETSVQGDRFYLGWHLNNNEQNILLKPDLKPTPTSFVPMITFQDRLRRPAVLERLLRTGSLPADPIGPVLTDRTPPPPRPLDMPLRVEIIPAPRQPNDVVQLPGQDLVQVNVATLPVRVRIQGQPGQKPTELRVLDNGGLEQVLANPALDPQDEIAIEFQIIPGRRSRKTVVVLADNGRESEVHWDYERSAPPDRDGRLVVLAFGPSFDRLEKYQLAHAPKDARLAGASLEKMVVQPQEPIEPYKHSTVDVIRDGTDDDAPPTARSLEAALNGLEAEVAEGRLGWPEKGDAGGVRDGGVGRGRVDTVVLFLDTHLLVADYRHLILGEAGDEHGLIQDAVNAQQVAESLGNLVRHGCRVVVFVDGIHRKSDPDQKFDVREWIRDLQARWVATYSASGDMRPSMVPGGRNGAFVQGIARVADGDRGDRFASEPSLTGEMLAESLFEKVQAATKKAQHPHFYGSRTSWDYLPLVGWPAADER